jgi:hypothetical protein
MFYGCFKSRSAVAMTLVVIGQQWPTAGLRLLPRAFLTRHTSPSPLLSLSSILFISPWQFKFGRKALPDEHADARGGGGLGWVNDDTMSV